MPEVIFSHPAINDLYGVLRVETGADEISWGYGLNTQTFPTFGGEVIQILSAYTTDLSIMGTVGTYAKMEEIYRWFVAYMQLATQDGAGDYDAFDETPITFSYPHRGWGMKLVVNELPGFRYGLEVVAPEWRLSAVVVESDKALTDQMVEHASKRKLDLSEFGRMTANIGYVEFNPFSAPFTGEDDADTDTTKAFGDLGDYYRTILDSYSQGDFENAHADYSKPAFLGNAGTGLPGNVTGLVDSNGVGLGTAVTP